MKYIIVVLSFVFCSISAWAQLNQPLSVLRYNSGAVMLEFSNPKEENGYDNSEKTHSYWITAETNTRLQGALRKAIIWANLNLVHKLDFSKEVIRLQVTKKSDYEFFGGHISSNYKEAILRFEGSEDGYFNATLEISDESVDDVNIDLPNKKALNELLSLLQGKAITPVDRIFH